MELAVTAGFAAKTGQGVPCLGLAPLFKVDASRMTAKEILAAVAHEFAFGVVTLFAALKTVSDLACL